jgi:hypothetical protein
MQVGHNAGERSPKLERQTLSWKSQLKQKKHDQMIRKNNEGLPRTSAKFLVFSQTLHPDDNHSE